MLSKLREMTANLPSFPAAIEEGNGYREYKMDEGSCFSWFIHRSGNDIAIHRWFNTAGSIFPEHCHSEKEWIIVYHGTMNLMKNGVETVLHKGDFSFNEPHTPHSATFPEDCKYITIMIPPSSEYPNGR